MTSRLPSLRTLCALLAGFALFASACGGSASGATESAGDSNAAGAEAPAQTEPERIEEDPAKASLVATTVSGGQIDFGSLEGQDVVLWFWAPW